MLKTDAHTRRLLALADLIDELPSEKFSMHTWGTHAEPRCICGWFMQSQCRTDKNNWQDAADMLGIERHVAATMFGQSQRFVDNKEAARALRTYAVTGVFAGW